MQRHEQKLAYSEPMLVKREQLRDVTAGVNGKYREKISDKFRDF